MFSLSCEGSVSMLPEVQALGLLLTALACQRSPKVTRVLQGRGHLSILLAKRVCSVEKASGELLLLSPVAAVPPWCTPNCGPQLAAACKPRRCGEAGAVKGAQCSQPAYKAAELPDPPPMD